MSLVICAISRTGDIVATGDMRLSDELGNCLGDTMQKVIKINDHVLLGFTGKLSSTYDYAEWLDKNILNNQIAEPVKKSL